MQFQSHISSQIEIDPHVETRLLGLGLFGASLGGRDATVAPGSDGEGSNVVVDALIAAFTAGVGRLAGVTGLDLPGVMMGGRKWIVRTWDL